MAMSKEVGGGAARGVGMSIGGGHVKKVPAQSDSARATKNWAENKKVQDAKSGKQAQDMATKASERNTGGITGKGAKNVVKIYRQMDR